MSKAATPVTLNALPAIPDFLGTVSRVQSVADLIQSAQGQLQQLRGMMVVNDQDESDSIPTQEGGETVAYCDRIAAIETGMRKLMEGNQDIADELVAEAVRRRRAHERALEKQHTEEAS